MASDGSKRFDADSLAEYWEKVKGKELSLATSSSAGLMSAEDKALLDNMQARIDSLPDVFGGFTEVHSLRFTGGGSIYSQSYTTEESYPTVAWALFDATGNMVTAGMLAPRDYSGVFLDWYGGTSSNALMCELSTKYSSDTSFTMSAQSNYSISLIPVLTLVWAEYPTNGKKACPLAVAVAGCNIHTRGSSSRSFYARDIYDWDLLEASIAFGDGDIEDIYGDSPTEEERVIRPLSYTDDNGSTESIVQESNKFSKNDDYDDVCSNIYGHLEIHTTDQITGSTVKESLDNPGDNTYMIGSYCAMNKNLILYGSGTVSPTQPNYLYNTINLTNTTTEAVETLEYWTGTFSPDSYLWIYEDGIDAGAGSYCLIGKQKLSDMSQNLTSIEGGFWFSRSSKWVLIDVKVAWVNNGTSSSPNGTLTIEITHRLSTSESGSVSNNLVMQLGAE